MEITTKPSTLPDVPQVWISHKDLIQNLYQGQDGRKNTLEEVRGILVGQYCFPDLPYAKLPNRNPCLSPQINQLIIHAP